MHNLIYEIIEFIFQYFPCQPAAPFLASHFAAPTLKTTALHYTRLTIDRLSQKSSEVMWLINHGKIGPKITQCMPGLS